MRSAIAWPAFAAWVVLACRIFAGSHRAGVVFAVVTAAALLAEGRIHFARARRAGTYR